MDYKANVCNRYCTLQAAGSDKQQPTRAESSGAAANGSRQLQTLCHCDFASNLQINPTIWHCYLARPPPIYPWQTATLQTEVKVITLYCDWTQEMVMVLSNGPYSDAKTFYEIATLQLCCVENKMCRWIRQHYECWIVGWCCCSCMLCFESWAAVNVILIRG